MGVLAALLEIITGAPFVADRVGQRMVLQLCGIALLYAVGGAGLLVWPAMASIERREGMMGTPEPGVTLADIPRFVWIILAVQMLLAGVAGWLVTGHLMKTDVSAAAVPLAAPEP